MKALKNNWYRHAREKLFFAAFVVSVSIQLPAQPGIYFDIPGQNLSEALVLFAEQADVNVIVPAEMLSGQVSSPLVGPFTVEDALSALLSKSTFGFDVVDGGRSVVIASRADIASTEAGSGAAVSSERVESMLVVSARHREERLHEVPMSIAVFGGERLERQGTTNLPQLSYFAGNTVFKVTRGTNSAMSAYIRGLGQDDPLAGYQTGVGVYVDGVYISRPQTPVMDIYDAERIEILRGPQGTLYGRNTIGGAIKYITKALSDEASGSVSVTRGSYGQEDVVLHAESPLDLGYVKVGATLAGFRRDGFGENIYTGGSNYDKDILGFRAKMEITPSDDISFLFSYDITEDNSSVKSGDRRIATDEYGLLRGHYNTAAGIAQSSHPYNNNSVLARGLSVTAKWNLSSQWHFTSISASRDDSVRSAIDFISLPSKHFDTHVHYDNGQKSQELRLSYEGDFFRTMLGAYYLDAKAMNAFELPIEVSPDLFISSFSLADVRTKSSSLFTSATFLMNNDVFLTTVGARYIEDRYSTQIYRNLFAAASAEGSSVPFFGGSGVGLRPQVFNTAGEEVSPNFNGQKTDYGFIPYVSVSWHPSHKVHLYASYSEGYKSGSFDPRGDYSEAVVRQGYDPEYADTYELGIKAFSLADLLTANVAFFHSAYHGMQIAGGLLTEEGDYIYSTTNGADARLRGAELDATLSLVDSRLQSTLGFGYLDAKYTRYIDGNGDDRASVRTFPDAPRLTASIGVQYTTPLDVFGQITLSSSVNYRSKVSILEEPTALDQSSYTLSNLGITWQSPDSVWQLGFDALNIFDKRYVVDGYHFPEFGFITAFYGDPRTISANLKYTF